jgi:hypothetical protein
MSANRLITDLGVKSLSIKERQGASWVNAINPKANTDYKVEIIFGNMNGSIIWDDEQYRKDNVELRLVALGFFQITRYKYKEEIVFYTNSSYSTEVSGTKYRTTFKISKFETTAADVLFEGYFRVKINIPSIFGFLKWDCGTYGSVRNRHWKKF